MLGSIAIGASHQINVSRHVCGTGVHLLAVDHIVVAITNCAAAQIRQVGTCMRLGEAETEGNLALDEARNIKLFLLLRAGRHNRWCAAAAQGDVDAGAREFFFDDVLREAVTALPAVRLGISNTQPAALINFLIERSGCRPRAAWPLTGRLRIRLIGDFRGDVVLNELANFAP